MQRFEQWLSEPGAGANLLRVESQMVQAILDQRKPKNVLQIGGKALLGFSDNIKTHYVHQREEMDFFHQGIAYAPQCCICPIAMSRSP